MVPGLSTGPARTALIAGGGIGGFASAIALAQQGWNVQVFEKAPALTEVGAGLQLSPNATRCLSRWGLLPAIAAGAFAPEAAVMRDGLTGHEIFRLPLGAAAKTRWGAPYLQIHRADLLDALVKAAQATGVTCHLDHAVTALKNTTDGVVLRTETGEWRGDLALSAVGIHGIELEGMARRSQPQFSGETAWRALIAADRVPAGNLAPDATVWAGPGQHAVTYYLRGGTLINLVAVIERRDWADEGWSVLGDPGVLRGAFDGWAQPVSTILEHVEHCHYWGLFDRPPMDGWVAGHVALIGDAAHPMLPFMAQGASQAIEDAASLARHLADTDIAPALQAWQTERRPRTARVQALSRKNAKRFHAAPGLRQGLARLPLHLARLSPGLAALPLNWLYGHDAT